MQTKRKVITSFIISRYPDAELYIISQAAITGLTANANFPQVSPLPPIVQPASPAPPTPNVTEASAAYLLALTKARKGSVNDTIAKDAARQVLENMLSPWANYVNLISNGDLVKLGSSGFDLNKEKQKAGILPKPANLVVTSPGSGQLAATVDPVENASSYNWQIRQVDPVTGLPTGPIRTESTTAAKLFLADADIVTAKQYSCSVVAVGSDRSAENFSDPVIVTIM